MEFDSNESWGSDSSDASDASDESCWFSNDHKISKNGEFILFYRDDGEAYIGLCDELKEPGWMVPNTLYCKIEFNKDSIRIDTLQVEKSHRKQGIAKRCFSFIKLELMETRYKIVGVISPNGDLGEGDLVYIFLKLGCYVTLKGERNKITKLHQIVTFKYYV